MADRHPHRGDLDRLWRQHAGHHLPAAGQAHVRGHLVLPGHLHHRGRAARGQLLRAAGQPVQELFAVRRGAGRAGAVVVRAQRGGVLPDHALPGDHVLLHPQGGQPADLLVPAVDRPLLGPGLHLHLGRTAPPALHRPARLGPVAGHGLLDHAHRAVVGRHAQRTAHPARCLGHGAREPGAQVPGSRRHRVRHVDLRGSDVRAQKRQRHHPLHRHHHRPRAHGRPGVERRPGLCHALLHHTARVPDRAVFQ